MSNLKLKLSCLVLVLATIPLAGCALITGQTTYEGTPADTELGRMLSLVPYSFLEEHDIWFGNPAKAKEMHGLGDLGSYQEIGKVIEQMPEEEQMRLLSDLLATLVALPHWIEPEVASLTGLDVTTADRLLCGDVIPPHGYLIYEGDFDEALIGQKLIGQGYTKTGYGWYSYYGIRGDFETDLRHPLGRLVLASLNRVAILDDTVITSPVTADITGILDVMMGNTPSIIENEACRALVASLGDVLMATLTTSERIIFSDLSGEEGIPEFNFAVPADWGVLRGYRMAALGYRAEGDRFYLDIALYYDNEASATADGNEIIKRMSSYKLDTWGPFPEKAAFTDHYLPGEPVVTRCAGGFVLKITCQNLLYPEYKYGISMVTGSAGWPLRDLLFLAPDPSLYIAKE